ncbi:MAG: beta-carotene 15,15'-monooxygenase [Intestinibacter bartlettii]|uniref:beta-carotene 15,15'-monooxygenase n=1 Tax=Intestinibacter bartlettii TaxID=261299 RepID=UPI0029120E99|nr:beta-carotene 15,15'-monooxygenase [Intestinibacter bartlettii]MDU6784385.1 beta-carotene 15,15'-monooxygenase [Peptoniphilus harei]MDU6824391.1 beta-carotene 15,15'-monooxygenase [Intestinibacter bartlettii]
MKNNMNINRACRYYLSKDKDFILNLLLFTLISLGFIFLLYKGMFDSRGNDYIILMLYVLMLGISLIMSNSMVVNLTVKDKLNKRIEFILASGINIKDVIKAYAIEMWRLSSIVPFLLFFLTYVLVDFKIEFKWIVGIFVTMIGMTYFEILFFNLISLSQKNFKFFKNIVFFGTTILIYMIGTFSEKILSLIERYNLNLIYIILGINIGLGLIFAIFSMKDLSRMNNESVINKEGSWS